ARRTSSCRCCTRPPPTPTPRSARPPRRPWGAWRRRSPTGPPRPGRPSSHPCSPWTDKPSAACYAGSAGPAAEAPVKIAPHKSRNRKWVQEHLDFQWHLLRIEIDNLPRVAHNLGALLGTVSNILQCSSVVAPDFPGVAKALRVGAAAALAPFRLRAAGDRPVLVRLGDERPFEMTAAALGRHEANSARWLLGFSFAALGRDRDALDALCRLPDEQVHGPPRRTSAWQDRLREALRAFRTGA